MDPNNPGQTPGDQTPPPASTPWGAPPPESPYGAPPAGPYGAPPPPWGAPPPESPYGAPPAWTAPAPTTPPRRGLPRRLLAAIGGFIVIVVIIGIAAQVLNPSRAGQVIFTTDAPTSSGASTCQIGHQVTSVSVGTSVYANYFFKSRLDNQTVTLTVLKNGASLASTDLTSAQSNGVDCLEDYTDLSTLGAGTYEFKLTTADGTVVSDGTLTIK